MWFTRLAISRPIVIWMALAAIAVLGLLAYSRLPAELNPRVDIPTLVVTTLYPGAGPPEIETQISKPLEEAVGTVSGVKDVYSSSQANVSIISMDLQVGTDLDVAMADVRGRVEAVQAQLPAEARPPVVAKLDINALPILYFGLESASLNGQQLRTLANDVIRPRLERVSGVAACQVIGGAQQEVHVTVDGHSLLRYGLTIEDVVNALKSSGRDVPAGSIVQSGRETDVRFVGALTSLEAIRNTQIPASPSASSGGSPPTGVDASGHPIPGGTPVLPSPPLTVADVAQVKEGQAEQTEINRVNDHEGVSLVISKASDANTVTVVDAVNAAFAQLKPTLPADIKRVTLRDDSVTVRDALQDVDASLVLGALLAMGVILLFLHNLRGTFIVSLAIPACMVATFLMMALAHFTLNQMTLLALSLSVGILVDDSIVVLESITRHIQEGEAPQEAAYNGRAEIGFADITTTLVDVVVFLPIAFMGGIVGGFFKQFGLVIATATLFSLVVSFSVTPMLASRWYRRGEDLEATRGLFTLFERLYRQMERGYRRVLAGALRRRGWVIAAGALGLAGIFALSFWKLTADFIPGADQGQISLSIEMPPGTSLNATDAVALQIEKRIRTYPDVAATVTTVGQILGGFGSIPQQGTEFAQITVRLKEKAGLLDQILGAGGRLRSQSDEQVALAFRKELVSIALQNTAHITANAIRSAEGLAAPVQLELRGADVNGLAQLGAQLRDRLAQIPGVIAPDVSVRSGKPEIRAVLDRKRAAEHSIPSALAGAILHDSIAGNTDLVLQRNGVDTPIRIRLERNQREEAGDVSQLLVGVDAQGAPVLLSDIADISLQTGPANIERNNGRRLVTVSADLAPETALSTVRQTMDKAIKAIPHSGIDVRWAGDAETLSDSAIPFATSLILAVILVYFVMASLFNNLGTPFVIMFTLPMALIGALGALVITGERISLVSAIGILMLIGLMGRNAILLLDYTNTLRKRGLERTQAIIDAGATRLRPILMTTTATIVGMLPVALRFGRASEIRAPMAIVVIGGLLVSTLLTLIVIPALYSLYDDLFKPKL